MEDPNWFTASIEAKLLDSELKTPLPAGGCAYLYSPPGTSNNSSEKYQRVMVWYFNVNRQGKLTTADITNWAKSAGGTPLKGTDPINNQTTTDTTGNNFDLPDTFSGWTKSTVVQVSGDNDHFGWEQTVLPAYTQGAQAKIDFALKADKAQAMARASVPGSTTSAGSDPTKALTLGLAAAFSTSAVVTNDEGYTAQLKVQGKLEPFTKDVKDAPPGKLHGISSSTVSGSVTNTTTGRQTKTPGAGVMAVYPLESAACDGYNGISVTGTDWQKPSYCAVELGSVEGTTLAPDASQSLKGTTLPQKLGTFPESGNAIAELNAPISFYMKFGNVGMASAGTNWKSDKGCLSSRLYGGATWNVVMDGWPDVICK
ncbi:hypothetical protein [Paenarthrobacter sp. NPDC057981]|uniref:hypothetical protein n=1 Tax=Paenarthrobacter sp. NPDC057981 TaxID=3346297 RepID=UPI0036D864D6